MTDDFDRAQEAHRAAFAMITAALTNPLTGDIETMIADYTTSSENPVRALADITHALVWHAAGALVTHTGGDVEKALVLVREGALRQERKEQPDV